MLATLVITLVVLSAAVFVLPITRIARLLIVLALAAFSILLIIAIYRPLIAMALVAIASVVAFIHWKKTSRP